MGLPVEHGVLGAMARGTSPGADALLQPGDLLKRPAGSGTPRTAVRREDGVWLEPVARQGSTSSGASSVTPSGLRVVGPGRRERAYVQQIEALDHKLADADQKLELARLVERGSQRLLDRIEEDLERKRKEAGELRQAQSRLVLSLGAVQAQNEALRAENQALRERVALLDAPAKSSWWARLLGR